MNSSTSRCYHEVINYDAHVKKPDQSLFLPLRGDTSSTSSTSDIPSLSSTSNAHTSNSTHSSYAALSSSNHGRADGVGNSPYPAVLGIDSVPATEFTTGGAGVTEQRRAGHYDGS